MLAKGGRQPIAYEPGSYVPGVCNLGAREIAKRRSAGIVSLVIASGLAVLLVVLDAPAATRWLVAIPVGFGAVGLLQARRRFCVQFAVMGISDSGDDVRAVRRVDNPNARAADRRTAIEIAVQSLAIALFATAIFVNLPI